MNMKKIIVLLSVLAILLMTAGCKDYSDISDQAANIVQMENENVLSVKNGTNAYYV